MELSAYVANALKKQGIISEEEVDICRYGLEIMLSSTVEVLSILLISLILRNFVETFLFFAAFIPLRIYAGGYHARTKMRCYFVSLSVYALFSLLTMMLPLQLYAIFYMIEILFSMIVVLSSAPVIHFHKSINDAEKKKYRSQSIKICCAQCVLIFAATLVFGNDIRITSFAMGQFAAAVALLVAVVQRKTKDNK